MYTLASCTGTLSDPPITSTSNHDAIAAGASSLSFFSFFGLPASGAGVGAAEESGGVAEELLPDVSGAGALVCAAGLCGHATIKHSTIIAAARAINLPTRNRPRSRNLFAKLARIDSQPSIDCGNSL